MLKPSYVGYAGCAMASAASAPIASWCTAAGGISLSCGWAMLAF